MAETQSDIESEETSLPRGAVQTEYEQASEEARYRHRLMHNATYLGLIINGILVGSAINLNENPELLGIVSAVAASSVLFVSVVIYVNNQKRGAAWARRTLVETTLTDHDIFRIQQDTITERAQFSPNEEGDGREYNTRSKNNIESIRAGGLPLVFLLIAVLWGGVAVYAFSTYFGII